MNYLKSKYLFSKLSLVFIMILMSSCFKQHERVTNKPTLKEFSLGEKWTWKWQRKIEGKVRAEGIDIKEVVKDNNELGFYYVHLKDTINIASILNRKQSKTPFRHWPLKVGKKWQHVEDWQNESGGKGRTSRGVEVVSFEEVTVKAGTFWAYKMKYDGTIENFSTGGKGKVLDYWWYSPELKDYIKHTQDDGYGFYTSELIKYSK